MESIRTPVLRSVASGPNHDHRSNGTNYRDDSEEIEPLYLGAGRWREEFLGDSTDQGQRVKRSQAAGVFEARADENLAQVFIARKAKPRPHFAAHKSIDERQAIERSGVAGGKRRPPASRRGHKRVKGQRGGEKKKEVDLSSFETRQSITPAPITLTRMTRDRCTDEGQPRHERQPRESCFRETRIETFSSPLFIQVGAHPYSRPLRRRGG